MSAVHLRLATDADLATLCELRIEFLSEVRGVPPEEFPDRLVSDTRRFFERTMSSGRILTWLAEDGGGTVGLASVVVHDAPPVPEDPRSHEGFVINLYVRAGSRGRGTGRRLLDACLGAAGDQDIRRFSLYATDAGRPLYERAGFAGHRDWMVVQVPRGPDAAPHG